MKITIELGKCKYEVVPCGRRCSFAKEDGHKERPSLHDKWEECHCTKGCHLPNWFHRMSVCGGVLDGAGLRKIGGAK